MDDNNEIQDGQVDSVENTPSDLSAQERRPKNKLKSAGKKVGKNLSDAFKEGFKGIWKALPLKVKLILIGVFGAIILIACIFVVYSDFFVTASEDTISNYYGAEDNTTKAASMYKDTGSLVYATNEDIKNIANDFFEKVKPVNNTLYDFMSKKYKNGDPDNSGVELKDGFWWFQEDALNINSEKTLYEHLLNAERYNFNKIRWRKYKRDVDEGVLPTSEMAVDDTSHLQYPDDSVGTTVDEFVNKTRPYLQSWIIPYGLFAGLLSDGTGDGSIEYGQFAYQILINGYHDITMNQYNLQVETVNTTQKVYDVIHYEITRTRRQECYGSGEDVECEELEPIVEVKTEVLETCHQDPVKVVSTETTWDVVYKLQSAKMFDRVINNAYAVHKYDKSVDTPEHYLSREFYESCKEVNPNSIPFDSEDRKAFNRGEIEEMTAYYEYTRNVGYTQNESKTWRDEVQTVSEEDRVLKTYDVSEYIEPSELTGDEKAYYDDLAVEENVSTVRLNRVDVINAKPEIYKLYLKNSSNFSENIGYPRSWLTFSYDNLKKHVKEIEEGDAGWNYLYGASLGLDIKVEKKTSIGVDGNYSILTDFAADGVLRKMQDVYAEYDLKDYGGYAWNNVPWYPKNADYAWENWKEYVEEIAPNYGVEPLWVLAKMSFESGGGRYSGYGTGAAAGPMQIQKSVHLNNTVSAYNVKTGKTDKIVMTREALSDDKTNIKIGIMMYANHLKSCSGNPYLAAQKYNYGNIGFVNTYANRIGKDKNTVISDVEDVGWVYESMQYHLNQCSKTGARWGDGYYAYKFAMYLDYLSKK